MRQRPIFGGLFGQGRYSLATLPCMSRGLHAVRFMVIDPQAGSVLSVAEDKTAALASARQVIRAGQAVTRQTALAAIATASQGKLWPDERDLPEHACKRRPVSKRRREIFAKCNCRCHYCSTPLTLDGRWHVEHMLPRALNGGDELMNLVAACVPCNLAKRDTSAIEFIARLTAASLTSK